MRRTFLIITVLSVAQCTLARDWQPFAGGGVGFDMVTPMQSFRFTEGGPTLLPQYHYSATPRVGVATGDFELYAEYHIQDIATSGSFDYWYQYDPQHNGYFFQGTSREEEWRLSSWGIGTRWVPGRRNKHTIHPILGFELALAKTKLYRQYADFFPSEGGQAQADEAQVSNQTSNNDLAVLLEFGVKAKIVDGITADLLFRGLRYEATFGPSTIQSRAERFLALYSMLELGIAWEPPFVIK